jgi:hypothetical protein
MRASRRTALTAATIACSSLFVPAQEPVSRMGNPVDPDPLVERVRAAALSMQRKSWE